MGIFDDLIPDQNDKAASSGGGLFDDLIPSDTAGPVEEAAPAVSKRPVARPPRQADQTDDARAERGFGRSAYMDGLTDAPAVPANDLSGVGSVDEQLETARRREQAGDDESQPIGDLGSRFARGATEVAASLPEAAAIAGAGNPNASALFAQEEVDRAREQIALAEQRLSENPDMSEEGRKRIQDVIAAERRKVAAYEPLIATAEGPLKPAAQDRPLFQRGDKLRAASEELFGTPDPQFDDRFISKLAEGGGSMAGFVGATILTGLPGIVATGSAVNSSGMYRRAIQEGASEEQARTAAYLGAIVGTTEAVPIGRALNLLPAKARGRVANALGRRLSDAFRSAGEEGAQEAMTEISNNLIARGIWNPDQNAFDGAGEAALIGAILGGGLGAIASTPRDDQRLDSPRLTEADRASPLPNAVIDDGKAAIEDLLSGKAPVQPVAQNAPTNPPSNLPSNAAPAGGETPQAPAQPVQEQAPVAAGAIPEPEAMTQAPAQPEGGDAEVLPVMDEKGRETGEFVRLNPTTGQIEKITPDAPVEVDTTPAPTPKVEASKEETIADEPSAPRQEAEQPQEQTGPDVAPLDLPQAAGPVEVVERKARGNTTLQKRPVANELKTRGLTVKPGSPLAEELKARGINARTHPGLFNSNGVSDWDNLPADEWGDYRYEVGEDGNGYLNRQGVIDALESEMRGAPVQVGEQADLQMAADAKEAQARFEAADPDPEEIDLGGVEDAAVVITHPEEDISTPSERMEYVARSVDAVMSEIGMSGSVAAGRRQEIIGILNDRGGNVEDAVWWNLHRKADGYGKQSPETRLAEQPADGETARGSDAASEEPGDLGRSQGQPGAENRGTGVAQDDRRADVGQAEEPAATAVSDAASEPNEAPAAATGIPQTERTEAGEQAVIPGAEQSAERSAEARKADERREMEARQQQSKARTAVPQDDAGPLFDTQGDMFDAPSTAPEVAKGETAGQKASKPSKHQRRLTEILRKEWTAREDLPDDDAHLDDYMAATERVVAARKALSEEFGPDVANTVLEEIEEGYKPKPADPVQERTDQEPVKKERIDDFGEKIGGARKDIAEKTGPRGKKSKAESAPAWRKRYAVLEQVDLNNSGGMTGKFILQDKKSGRQVRDGYRVKVFDSEAEAEAAIPLYEVARNHRVRSKGEEFSIDRVTGKKSHTFKDGFKTREEAMEYMAKNAVEIIETDMRLDDRIHPALEQALREGEDRRKDGRDVTPEDFSEVFGFRGVEFGKWNNGAERQHILNQAFDSFLDLSEILGVPPKAISLNGDLALAFGSRGHGLTGGRAHYERNYGVINLTKIQGAGALAHEWMHAADHYFGRQDGKASSEKITNERGDEVFDAKDQAKDYASHGFQYSRSGVREEVRAAFKAVMQTIAKRKAEFKEDVSTREVIENRAAKQLEQKLKSFRDELATEQRYGRKKAPATKAQLLKVDTLIKRIQSGKLGEKVEAPTKSRSTFPPMFNEPVLQLAEIYKDVRGRQAYRKHQGRDTGPAVELQFAIEAKRRADQFLAEAKEQKVKDKTVASEFVSEAWILDRGRASGYWATNHELIARAFESYVYDRLKDIDARNDFLAYEKHNLLPEYLLFNVKPYPEGQERADINAAFRNLFDTIQTEETDTGVRMYQRQGPSRRGDPAKLQALLPELKARLDKMMIRGVDLSIDQDMGEQGAVEFGPEGIEILIGNTLDGMNTVNHEAIHVLRARGLFTDAEWSALAAEAESRWMAEYDIEARYPDLSKEAQIEEAIAEAFAAHVDGQSAQGRLKSVFAKISRFFRAMKEVLTGQGINTPEDIFETVESGEVGSRDGRVTGEELTKYQRPSSAVRKMKPEGVQATAVSTHSAAIPDDTRFERFRRLVQDRMLVLRRMEEATEELTGQGVRKEESPYFAEERYSGRVGYLLDEIDANFTQPIVDLISEAKIEITDHNGTTREGSDAVSLWLMARHAKERNAHIASINDQMPDGGSGLTNAEADAILQQSGPYQARLDQIGALTDKLGKEMITAREDAGLLSAQDAHIWRTMYQHYVPLQKFAEDDMFDGVVNDKRTAMGRKFNVRGKEGQRALGRSTEAFDPLATLLTQAMEVTVRAEKNRVAKVMYNFAVRHPNPAMYEISTPETQRFYNNATGKVETRVVGAAARPLAENEMALKVDGKEHRITFKDPRLAEALGQLGTNEMGKVTSIASLFSRYFSSINTMLSPPFIIVNAFRDMMTAQVNLGAAGGNIPGKLRKAAMRDWVKSLRGAHRGLGGKTDTEYAKWFNEYSEAGGRIHFWKVDNPEGQSVDFKKRVARASRGKLTGTVSRLALPSTRDNPVLSMIENVNMAVDNAVRLATYAEARKNGWSKADAASLAKNLTVNFNRRGEIGATMNAWYPFANAAIQGSHVILKAMRSRQVKKIVGGMVLFGFANDLLAAMLSGTDDDGELEYDQLPVYKSERNIIVATPLNDEGYITIPLPYGYNVFFFAGQQLGKIVRGVKSPDEAAGQLLKATVGAFSPIAGESGFEMLAPTVLDFANEFDNNRDWLGRPIRPENPYGDYGPQAYKEFNASAPSRAVARGLNTATGGSPLESGLIDVSPEYIDHFFKFMTGGAGRFAGRMYGVAERAAEGTIDQTSAYELPLVRVLYTESGEFLNQNRYFEFREAVQEARKQSKLSQETGHPMTQEMKDLNGLWFALRAAEKRRKKIGDRLEAVYADETLTGRQREARLKPLKDDRNTLYLEFNAKFIEKMGPQAE